MDILEFILPFLLIILFAILFVWAAMRLRRTGGTMTTTMHGAVDAFYNNEKKEAVEMVVEKQAGKKMDEQASGEPEKRT